MDLITVTPDEKSVDPILYRFNSGFLHHPLAITSPVPGETKITLLLLTKEKVNGDHLPPSEGILPNLGAKPNTHRVPIFKRRIT